MKTINDFSSHIILKGLQVKSLEKAQKLAKALAIIEIECGIKSVEINLQDFFICCDIDLSRLKETPMERLLKEIMGDFPNEKD